MRPTVFIRLIRHSCAILIVLWSTAGVCHAQEGPWAPKKPQVDQAFVDRGLLNSIPQLQAQVRELEAALQEMRAEAATYRAEMVQIRRELQGARTLAVSNSESAPQPPGTARPSDQTSHRNGVGSVVRDDVQAIHRPGLDGDEQRVAKLEEDYQLLSGKVDDQYQTKVESASKYRARLSGILLLNIFGNRGSVDNLDFPTTATPRAILDSSGTFGATVRQTQLGLEVFGPQLGGAKTSAAVQFDFAGGFANAVNGVNYGIIRMRTATMRLDWPHTSLVAGQDSLFFSPLSATSLASLASTAFSWAGNIWAWVPQARVEHRLVFSEKASVTLQGGILDPQSGELPGTGFLRSAQAGEKSHQPGYAARVAWSYGPADRNLTLGIGGYYDRQNWGFGRTVDGWAGTADASVPLGSRFSFTAEFYRGRAIGGLEGATGRSIVMRGGPLADQRTAVKGLNVVGGWMQLKFEPTSKLEFNAAAGQDNPFASDLRLFPDNAGRFATVARNRSASVNFIYRPRSDLLFSTEYRRMRTWDIRGGSRTADHINVSMGILF